MRNCTSKIRFATRNCSGSCEAERKTVALIITNCSKRKRAPLDPNLHAEKMEPGALDAVAVEWSRRLGAANRITRAQDLYAGRAFVEASRAASVLSSPLAVVSAGLGLIHGGTEVPSYSLTTAQRDPDNILRKIDATPSDWWASLQSRSPFRSYAIETETGPILAALSAGYLAMVAADWAKWPTERLARLRLFTKEQPVGIAEALVAAWMPYDDRLDALGDGYAGTQADFAQRAMRHYAGTIGVAGTLVEDRAAVRRSLEGLTVRQVPTRLRHTDEEIRSLVRAHWVIMNGRSGAMLRHLRDTLGVACEQGRFKGLFADVANERTGAQ